MDCSVNKTSYSDVLFAFIFLYIFLLHNSFYNFNINSFLGRKCVKYCPNVLYIRALSAILLNSQFSKHSFHFLTEYVDFYACVYVSLGKFVFLLILQIGSTPCGRSF